MHAEFAFFRNNGLFDSSCGIGRFTSGPKFAPAFELFVGSYGPTGNTASALRPYCQIRRRMSPNRWPVRKRSSARSVKSRFWRPEAEAGTSADARAGGDGSG